ncbi:MAG: hypothetical protein ABI988_11950 [Nitrospirota bacterium]
MEIFRADQDIRYNAVIDYSTSVGGFHAEGFKRAVEQLLRRTLDDTDDTLFDRDTLILPILALFRHYLELRFKEIIVLGDGLGGGPVRWPLGHDLRQLWKRCRRICEDVLSSDLAHELDLVGRCVDEFVALDPKCENFRYPLDKNGQRPTQHLVVGLKNLADIVEKVSTLLDGVSMDISVRLQDSPQPGT